MDLGLILQHRKKCIEILYLGVHWNLEKKAGYLKPKEIFNTFIYLFILPLYICICWGGGRHASFSDDDNSPSAKRNRVIFIWQHQVRRKRLEPSTSANWVTYFSGLSLEQDV